MKISKWLDEKEARTSMYLTSNCLKIWSMLKTRMKPYFTKRSIPAVCSVRKTIRSLRSNGMTTGIYVEARTRKQVSIHQK